jgi:parallel beta-helix repeat protein
MNDDRSLERRISASFDASASSREPAGLLENVLLTSGRSRQRPRWLALIKEPPMRLTSGLAVGSPTARIAVLVIATLLLVVLATSAVVAGSTLLAGSAPIIVAQDGSGAHETIADAVTAAKDGDTILVRPGTYIGTVIIDKDIVLRGDGPREEIVLEFTADSPTVLTEFAPIPYGVLLVDTVATVSDMTVRGPNVAAAFIVVGGAPTLERVVDELEGDFSGSPQTSVGLVHGAGATVRDSLLDGPIWDLGSPTVAGYEGVGGTGRVVVDENVVDAGIWVTVTDGGSVTNNRVTNGGIEFILEGGGSALIEGNDTAMYLSLKDTDGTGITVRDNVVRGEDEFGVGVYLGSGSPVVENNDISGARVGITVPGGGSPTIRGNEIKDNGTGISVAHSTAAPIIEDNRFCGNEQDLVTPEGPTLTLDPSNVICPAEAAATSIP